MDYVREIREAAQVALFDNTPDEILARRQGEPVPLIVAFGGGLNSTAALVLLREWNDVPDAILFADTGGETPDTYAHVRRMDEWCQANGFPSVVTVRRECDHERQKHEAKYDTLEEECLVKKCLPSIAYYGRSCSQKWKHAPQEKWANGWPTAQARWASGGVVVKVIGYDADEPERVKFHRDEKYCYWHPLVDHDIGRDECVAVIRRAGLPVPPKSSCFFCPEMTPDEIRELDRSNPDLLARALAMEANANLTGIKGLGKHEYSWREMVESRYSLPVVQAKRVPLADILQDRYVLKMAKSRKK